MSSIHEVDVVVVGAGLTGLTTAFYLNKANVKFLVLEKAPVVGGVIQSVTENGFTYEQGPNTGVVGNTTVVEVFEELADTCTLELASDTAKKRFILKNGKWECLPQGPADAIKTPLFTLKDKFRILGEPFRPAGKDPHENLASFVKRRMGQSFFDYAIDPFIIGVYAGDPNYLIPKYALPKLYNLEQKYGSLIGGSFRKGFIKKTEAEKKVNRKVFSCKGGLASLPAALYKSIGTENVVLNAQDITVQPTSEGYTITAEKGDDQIMIHAKKVISTVGAYALESMLPFVDTAAMEKLNSLHYTKVIEVVLGFNKWEGIELDGFGGLIPSIEKRDLLGVLYMSTLFEDRAPKGGATLSIFMGGVRRQDLIVLSDAEIREIVARECTDLMGLKEFKPDLFKIMRHNKAIPQYGVESGERFETIRQLEQQYAGLIIGGNLRDGIGMADRMNQAKALAEAACM
ncbi:MAG: protoporphyrinogen oxidase [Paludibacter sp.]|nr:protoporphyrinogen oxidase [Paludibacter sp.]